MLLSGDVERAERLREGIEPVYPMHSAGLAAARAQILAARGDLRGAADGFATVAAMWGELDARLEQGYALLGRARCLTRSPMWTPASR